MAKIITLYYNDLSNNPPISATISEKLFNKVLKNKTIGGFLRYDVDYETDAKRNEITDTANTLWEKFFKNVFVSNKTDLKQTFLTLFN